MAFPSPFSPSLDPIPFTTAQGQQASGDNTKLTKVACSVAIVAAAAIALVVAFAMSPIAAMEITPVVTILVIIFLVSVWAPPVPSPQNYPYARRYTEEYPSSQVILTPPTRSNIVVVPIEARPSAVGAYRPYAVHNPSSERDRSSLAPVHVAVGERRGRGR